MCTHFLNILVPCLSVQEEKSPAVFAVTLAPPPGSTTAVARVATVSQLLLPLVLLLQLVLLLLSYPVALPQLPRLLLQLRTTLPTTSSSCSTSTAAAAAAVLPVAAAAVVVVVVAVAELYVLVGL
jgi:hypothetical protein